MFIKRQIVKKEKSKCKNKYKEREKSIGVNKKRSDIEKEKAREERIAKRNVIVGLFRVIFISIGISMLIIFTTSENYHFYGNKYDGFGNEASINENNEIIMFSQSSNENTTNEK